MTESIPPMTPSDPPQIPPSPSPSPSPSPLRWMRPLLIASLALNLAVAGVVGGAALRGPGKGGPPIHIGDMGFGPFTEALSRQDRDALRDAFLKNSGGLGADRQEKRADFAALLTALRNDPFEAAAVTAIIGKQQARNSQKIALGQKLLLDRIAAMSVPDRLGFADRLEQALRRGPDSKPPKPGAD